MTSHGRMIRLMIEDARARRLAGDLHGSLVQMDMARRHVEYRTADYLRKRHGGFYFVRKGESLLVRV